MIEMHKLAQGAQEPQVMTLQALLNEFNGAGLALDGGFGQLTYNAVINYQRSLQYLVLLFLYLLLWFYLRPRML